MYFRDYQAVLDGRKTQTRRVKQPGEVLVLIDDVKTVLTSSGRDVRLKWQVGRTYAICPGRGHSSEGRFKLVDIREERVQDISGEDAIAEGFPERLELFPLINREWKALKWFRWLWDDIWKRRPEYQWGVNPEIWVLVMEVDYDENSLTK